MSLWRSCSASTPHCSTMWSGWHTSPTTSSAIVQGAIRALGFTYHAHPLPGGYGEQIGRFDPARDAPTHRRGSYVSTEGVQRVSLDGLSLLGERGGR